MVEALTFNAVCYKCTRTIIQFSKEKKNYLIVCFTQCTLFFPQVGFLLIVSYWFDGYLEELTFTSWYPAEKVVLRHFRTSLSSCFWSRINKSSKRSTWRSENNKTTFLTNWWIIRNIHRSRAPLHKRRVSVEMNLRNLIIYCFPVHICATKKQLKKQLWRRSENKRRNNHYPFKAIFKTAYQ